MSHTFISYILYPIKCVIAFDFHKILVKTERAKRQLKFSSLKKLKRANFPTAVFGLKYSYPLLSTYPPTCLPAYPPKPPIHLPLASLASTLDHFQSPEATFGFSVWSNLFSQVKDNIILSYKICQLKV